MKITSLLILFLTSFVVCSSAGNVGNSNAKPSKRRTAWSQEEDALLKSIADSYCGKINWRIITDEFNRMNNSESNHKGIVACRSRYMDYLGRGVDRNFSEEDDKKLMLCVGIYGKKWHLISKFFTNKTPLTLSCRHAVLIKKVITNCSDIDTQIKNTQNKKPLALRCRHAVFIKKVITNCDDIDNQIKNNQICEFADEDNFSNLQIGDLTPINDDYFQDIIRQNEFTDVKCEMNTSFDADSFYIKDECSDNELYK